MPHVQTIAQGKPEFQSTSARQSVTVQYELSTQPELAANPMWSRAGGKVNGKPPIVDATGSVVSVTGDLTPRQLSQLKRFSSSTIGRRFVHAYLFRWRNQIERCFDHWKARNFNYRGVEAMPEDALMVKIRSNVRYDMEHSFPNLPVQYEADPFQGYEPLVRNFWWAPTYFAEAKRRFYLLRMPAEERARAEEEQRETREREDRLFWRQQEEMDWLQHKAQQAPDAAATSRNVGGKQTRRVTTDHGVTQQHPGRPVQPTLSQQQIRPSLATAHNWACRAHVREQHVPQYDPRRVTPVKTKRTEHGVAPDIPAFAPEQLASLNPQECVGSTIPKWDRNTRPSRSAQPVLSSRKRSFSISQSIGRIKRALSAF